MKQRTRGFTLVEVLVVITIIAILLAIVLSNILGNKTKSRDNVRISNVQVVRLALEEYRSVCGVFPNSLLPSANNGQNGGTCSKTFGEILPHLPVLPERANPSLVIGTIVPIASVYNNYFYAGLSSSNNGPCYDYHLGIELEFAPDNGQPRSAYLDQDHDYTRGQAPYTIPCLGSAVDFGGTNAATADAKGLYDFRSTKK